MHTTEMDISEQHIRATYGDTSDSLVSIKQRHDLDLFRVHRNLARVG